MRATQAQAQGRRSLVAPRKVLAMVLALVLDGGASPAITSKTPTISQKSPNRHDLPLVESMRLMNAAHGGKADMKWYPLANSKR